MVLRFSIPIKHARSATGRRINRIEKGAVPRPAVVEGELALDPAPSNGQLRARPQSGTLSPLFTGIAEYRRWADTLGSAASWCCFAKPAVPLGPQLVCCILKRRERPRHRSASLVRR